MENQEHLWQAFQKRCGLTQEQCEQFKTYYTMLVAASEMFSLTTITDLESVLSYHFEDSLALEKYTDLMRCKGILDVGSGAGFPGIPLKIKYPQLQVVLIEVSQKKNEFLAEVIQELGLKDIECCSLDWRTFLRKTAYEASIVCARASLQPVELVRMFKPSSPYKHATLVYWAAKAYAPEVAIEPYVQDIIEYEVGRKLRLLVVMKSCDEAS